MGPAFDAAIATAPADIKPTVETLIANSEEQGPEFETAYAETVGLREGRTAASTSST